MLVQRWRPVWFIGLAILAIWVVAATGYWVALQAKMTPEKVQAYVASLKLGELSKADREKAIRELARRLNSLTAEERRRARTERASWSLLEQMTEQERLLFVELTMPTGFKQMLTSFEELPEDRRQRAINDTLRRLREAQTQYQAGLEGGTAGAGETPPWLTPEMEKRIRTIGLQAFYTQSSAQTKAELAPVMEELQRVMESGRLFRRR